MKVLILSCNTGGGHNSAGRALCAAFAAAGVECRLVNALSFAGRLSDNVVCQGHNFIYRHLPALYGAAYRYVEGHPPRAHHKSGVYRANVSYAGKLWKFISEGGYDTVVCVHIFPANALTRVLRRHPGAVRSCLVATDYTCSPGVADTEMDAYIIPHRALAPEFEAAGLPAERLHALGIPVGPHFEQCGDAAAARQALGLPQQGRIVVLMGGSMGGGHMRRLAEACLAELPQDGLLVALCGNNHRLQRELAQIQNERLRVTGFTDRVDLYMDAASLLITKAGGLSATEAAAKGVPMLLADTVPGLESHNCRFFVRQGWALTAPDETALAALMGRCLQQEERTRALCAALRDFPRSAADEVAALLLRQAAEKDGPAAGGAPASGSALEEAAQGTAVPEEAVPEVPAAPSGE